MNENKLAWIITGVTLGLLCGLLVLAALFSPAAPNRNANTNNATVSQYAQMFKERNRLQARVNYCERQKQGDTPAYRRACDEAEIGKLDEYREQIKRIDAELAKLGESSAP